MTISLVRDRINAGLAAHLAALQRLVAQKSISSRNDGVVECAHLLREVMIAGGIETDLLPTAGQPVVFGQVRARADQPRPTVLFYGHYDVQPPEPLEAWTSPPFEATVRNGRLYGRGTGDNKGQLLAHVLAVQAWLETVGELPVNVKFLFEGEEEIGSPSLAPFVASNRDLLAADLVLTADGPMHESGAPLVVFGVRGVMNFDLHLHTATTDHHSGNRGGVIADAAWEMVQLLATMRDADGRITIDGFYDDVLAPTQFEASLLARLPFDPEQLARVYGVAAVRQPAMAFYQHLMFQPTLTINGLSSGHAGEGTRNIIPSSATARLEVRLVANQDPNDLIEKIQAHIARHNPDVRLTRREEDMHPSRTSAELPVSQAVIAAVAKGFGREPLVYPCMGGSLPDQVWTRVLGVPSILVPYANADEANHAPDENLRLDCFHAGILCSATLLDELGRLDSTP
ncbi:MAG: M20/M25/M40 family metallo-hydrolase [Wenzhouxiangella sp.]|nr:MAG: M20/M25/M40 family metallo-hydrolase [Wenzhouxiangella sp.]